MEARDLDMLETEFNAVEIEFKEVEIEFKDSDEVDKELKVEHLETTVNKQSSAYKHNLM
ncbi:MAG: hypothetical protein N3A69_14580 [Leptospiraceae bacterium]|nr:hypothetical protein [Leptospiraceae bacterium]